MNLKQLSGAGKTILSAGALSLLFLSSCDKASQEVNPASEDIATSALRGPASEPGQEMVPNQLLVKFRKGTSESVKKLVLEKIGGKVEEKILTRAMERFGDSEGLLVVNTPLAALDAIAKARGSEGIEYAEPNYIYQHQATDYFASGSLWGMYGPTTSPANQYGCQAGAAWTNNHKGSGSVVVGIIDEGISITHPDLAANIWVNPGEVPGNGKDDDANGYIDDINGWDFDGKNNTVYDGGTKGTVDNHGTHVAGTIGGIGGDGKGVAGVNWEVKMISCKFLGRRGGTTANAIKAVDYLTTLKSKGINIVASNNSWGGGGFSQGLADAINRANNADILFIAAAGNGGNDGVGDNNDNVASYPSNYASTNVIAVAAITSSGAKASFSNYGANTVDLGAPGSGIISSVAPSGYASYSGTSMATPHVTGGAALYAASHPGSTAAQIKASILSAAVPTATLSGKCATGGRLNVSGF